MDKMDCVREFHAACGRLEPRGFDDIECRRLRASLISEEFYEFLEAEDDDDIVEIADALADLLYVIYGTAHEYNIPLDEVFEEVHRSNMTKFIDGYKREDGKHIKGPSYTPADVIGVLRRHGTI